VWWVPAINWDHVWLGSVRRFVGLGAMPGVVAGWSLLDLQSSSLSWAKAPSLSSSLPLSGIKGGGPSLLQSLSGMLVSWWMGSRYGVVRLANWFRPVNAPLSTVMRCDWAVGGRLVMLCPVVRRVGRGSTAVVGTCGSSWAVVRAERMSEMSWIAWSSMSDPVLEGGFPGPEAVEGRLPGFRVRDDDR
jgi:hypothetical protein